MVVNFEGFLEVGGQLVRVALNSAEDGMSFGTHGQAKTSLGNSFTCVVQLKQLSVRGPGNAINVVDSLYSHCFLVVELLNAVGGYNTL